MNKINKCYIIRIDNKDTPRPIQFLNYKNENINIIFINPSNYSGSCMKRYDIVYYDKHFYDDKAGQFIIKNIIKPLAIKNNFIVF